MIYEYRNHKIVAGRESVGIQQLSDKNGLLYFTDTRTVNSVKYNSILAW